MDNGISITLVAALVAGSLLVVALLFCYGCVFRQLCCQSGSSSGEKQGLQGKGHPYCGKQQARRDEIHLTDTTHVDSGNVTTFESDRV